MPRRPGRASTSLGTNVPGGSIWSSTGCRPSRMSSIGSSTSVGADVVARRGQFGERRQEVERGQHVGRVQQPRRLGRHLIAEPAGTVAVRAPGSCPRRESTFSSYSFSSGVM